MLPEPATLTVESPIDAEKRRSQEFRQRMAERRTGKVGKPPPLPPLPAVKADGGDVALQGIEGTTVTVSLMGACRGCPMAQSTLTDFVAERIKLYAPEITDVLAE